MFKIQECFAREAARFFCFEKFSNCLTTATSASFLAISRVLSFEPESTTTISSTTSRTFSMHFGNECSSFLVMIVAEICIALIISVKYKDGAVDDIGCMHLQ